MLLIVGPTFGTKRKWRLAGMTAGIHALIQTQRCTCSAQELEEILVLIQLSTC